jgi:hypothetical protein
MKGEEAGYERGIGSFSLIELIKANSEEFFA